MNDYRVVETTRLTHADIFSLQADKDIENGAIVGKGDLIDGETSVYEATDDYEDAMYLVANPAWSYEDSHATDQNEENFINKAGVAFRAYRLGKDMKFKIYNIEDTFEVGDEVEYDAENGKYVKASSGNTGGGQPGDTGSSSEAALKVVAIEEVGFPYCVGQFGAPVDGDDDNYYGYATGAKTIKYTIEVM